MKMVGVTFPCGTDNSTSPLHGHGRRLRSLTVGELRMEAAQGRGPGQGAGRPGVLSRWAGHGAPAPAAVCDRTQVPPAGVCAGVSECAPRLATGLWGLSAPGAALGVETHRPDVRPHSHTASPFCAPKSLGPCKDTCPWSGGHRNPAGPRLLRQR